MRCVVSVVVVLLLTPLAWGQAITGFTGGTQYDSYYGSATGDVVGWRFRVTESMSLTALGIWNEDTSSPGSEHLTTSHPVGIWNTNQVLLASVTVTPSDTIIGDWIYAYIPPIALTPGETYTIGALYNSGDLDWYISSASSVSTISRVSWVEAVYPGAAELGFVFPTASSAPSSIGRFGPNFIEASLGTDLSIYKTDDSCWALPGDPITYTITVANISALDAMGAFVDDLFPPEITGVTWTCTPTGGGACTPAGINDINDIVNLPAGAVLTYTAIGTVDPTASGRLVNTATVMPPMGLPDINMSNNTSTDSNTLEVPIFCDDFETGDTLAWVTVVP